MKRILLSAAAIMAFGLMNAQESGTNRGFSGGDVFITGSVGYQSQKTGDIKSDAFTVSPMVGFFVTGNIAVGGQVAYTSSTEIIETGLGSYELEVQAFGIGAFGRYYATPANAFSLFGQLSVAYQTAKSEAGGDAETEVKANGFGIDLSPGISYFVSDRFALEATIGSIGYSTANPDVEGVPSTNTFNIGLNLSDISFGVLYKF